MTVLRVCCQCAIAKLYWLKIRSEYRAVKARSADVSSATNLIFVKMCSDIILCVCLADIALCVDCESVLHDVACQYDKSTNSD